MARSSLALLAVLFVFCVAACGTSSRGEAPRLPPGRAGEVIARAIEAAGGWEGWLEKRDVAYVATITVFDLVGNVSSQSIGWFMAPLHGRVRARMESIGNETEVVLGIDGDDSWIVRAGELDEDPARLELIQFNLASNFFWFSLPFALAEMPAEITDLGERTGSGGERWNCLKAVFQRAGKVIPGEWFVFYFDAESGLIDRVHVRANASFLRHQIWIGKWLDYRDWNGVKRERLRKFFPADSDGEIVGNLVVEHLVEYVRFNNSYAPEHFDRPHHARGARLVLLEAPSRSFP